MVCTVFISRDFFPRPVYGFPWLGLPDSVEQRWGPWGISNTPAKAPLCRDRDTASLRQQPIPEHPLGARSCARAENTGGASEGSRASRNSLAYHERCWHVNKQLLGLDRAGNHQLWWRQQSLPGDRGPESDLSVWPRTFKNQEISHIWKTKRSIYIPLQKREQ